MDNGIGIGGGRTRKIKRKYHCTLIKSSVANKLNDDYIYDEKVMRN